jgi:hypothetical protein
MNADLRKVVIIVAVLNLAYFGVEFDVARAIGSVSLFADSVDFLEDASVNFLIAIALRWSATNRARLGMALTGVLLIPGLATLWTAWDKFMAPLPPAPLAALSSDGGADRNASSAADRVARTCHFQNDGRPTARRVGAYTATSSRHVLPWCFRDEAPIWDALLSHWKMADPLPSEGNVLSGRAWMGRFSFMRTKRQRRREGSAAIAREGVKGRPAAKGRARPKTE